MCGTTSIRSSLFGAHSARCTASGVLLAALAALSFSGCKFVPKSQLDAAELQNQTLLEQKKALLAENENLKAHSRNLEDQVKQAEEELADLDERAGTEQRRLSAHEVPSKASIARRRPPIASAEAADDDTADRSFDRRGETVEPDSAAADDGWTAPDAERR